MNLDVDILNAAKHTADNINKLQIATGRNPATIAGVSIFMIT